MDMILIEESMMLNEEKFDEGAFDAMMLKVFDDQNKAAGTGLPIEQLPPTNLYSKSNTTNKNISKRTTFMPHQLEEMKRVFEINRYPNNNDRAVLAFILNLRLSQVYNWFQNQRAKARRRKPPRKTVDLNTSRLSANPLPSTTTSSSLNNTENNGMSLGRLKYTIDQLKTLEQVFKISQCPNMSVITELAMNFKLETYQIDVWFKNRRANARRSILSRKTVKLTNSIFPPGSLELSEPSDYSATGYGDLTQLNISNRNNSSLNSFHEIGGANQNHNNNFGCSCVPYAIQPQDNPGQFSTRQDLMSQSPPMRDYFGHQLNKQLVDSYALSLEMEELPLLDDDCDIEEILGYEVQDHQEHQHRQ